MNKNIIVTGGNGFVGSNLVDFLLSKNYIVNIICRENSDLSNLSHIKSKINICYYDNNIKNLIGFFKESKAEIVFHLASNFIAEHQSTQINSLVDSNISFGLHVLEAMKESGIKKMVNTGTSWQHYNNNKYSPVCLYAATKQAFEALVQFYVESENFKVINLKLFDTYGENDKRPKLINLLNKFADEQTELIMTKGEQVLNLVHVSDVCRAYYSCLQILNKDTFNSFKSYKVCNNKSYKLKDVIKLFEKVTDKKINVKWGGKPYRKREVMRLWENGDNLPNWEAKISLEEGLKKYKYLH